MSYDTDQKFTVELDDPYCADCLNHDGILNLMTIQGTEIVEDKEYVILWCDNCGSSIRVPKMES